MLETLSKNHPKPAGKTFTYGTAGFRMKAVLLDSVLFRMGLLAVLRSKKLQGKHIGVMITASHNAAEDNGVKLVEPLGEMLLQSWELYATQLANAEDEAALQKVIQDITNEESIDVKQPAHIVVGRDTRESGPSLVASLKDGVDALGGLFNDQGVLTTPQLHYIVRCLNTLTTAEPYGEPTEQGYFSKLSCAFLDIIKTKPKPSTLYVDAANGVGAHAMAGLLKVMGQEHLTVQVINDDVATFSKLNHNCGADFVKLNQTLPQGFSMTPGKRFCSLDGDADRVVYYYVSADNKFKLLDGDKIATLAAKFISRHVRQAGILIDGKEPSVGLVQTAYANGSSTGYAKEQLKNVPVVFTKTGVKHLHHAAEEFDVGVYFEANGHGTVLFSTNILKSFKTTEGTTPEQVESIRVLRSLSDLINQAVGDALSDMLMVEAILVYEQMSLEQWDACYTDLPNKQEKVKVKNRHIFKPIKAETELAEPVGLQDKIFQQVAKYKKGRSFVRPSGTEDIVRVYAEAEKKEDLEALVKAVCALVQEFA